MTPKRKFYRKGYQHICQISADKGLIFYNDADFIVLFTIICRAAVKYKAHIIALDIMYNHFHLEASFDKVDDMSLFVNEICSIFARNYNFRYNRSGQLFKKSYNSSAKWSEGDIENNYVYVNNNPMPKGAVKEVSQYRWNFLAYMASDHPFSEPLDKMKMSPEMKRAIKLTDRIYGGEEYISYGTLGKIFCKLTETERQQATDYIVVKYNVIDYAVALKKWGSYERIKEMLSIVKGSEYDISEDVSREDYTHYDLMKGVIRKAGFNLDHRRFDSNDLDPIRLSKYKQLLLKSGCGSEMEVDKFLHLGPYSRRKSEK